MDIEALQQLFPGLYVMGTNPITRTPDGISAHLTMEEFFPKLAGQIPPPSAICFADGTLDLSRLPPPGKSERVGYSTIRQEAVFAFNGTAEEWFEQAFNKTMPANNNTMVWCLQDGSVIHPYA